MCVKTQRLKNLWGTLKDFVNNLQWIQCQYYNMKEHGISQPIQLPQRSLNIHLPSIV